MMEEIIRLSQKCIDEMLKMSPDEIKDFRQEWLQRLDDKESSQNLLKIRYFAKCICDYTLDQVTQKTA